MFDGELKLVDENGNAVDVQWGDVVRVEGRIGVQVLEHGCVPYAGAERSFVALTTRITTHEIPRSVQNDSEILTFLLARGTRIGVREQ